MHGRPVQNSVDAYQNGQLDPAGLQDATSFPEALPTKALFHLSCCAGGAADSWVLVRQTPMTRRASTKVRANSPGDALFVTVDRTALDGAVLPPATIAPCRAGGAGGVCRAWWVTLGCTAVARALSNWAGGLTRAGEDQSAISAALIVRLIMAPPWCCMLLPAEYGGAGNR